jgi:hypothetical protein
MSNETNARPTILFHCGQVFDALNVSKNIFSFLLGSLSANLVRVVDIIDTTNFSVLRAILSFVREGKSKERS